MPRPERLNDWAFGDRPDSEIDSLIPYVQGRWDAASYAKELEARIEKADMKLAFTGWTGASNVRVILRGEDSE